MSDDTATMEIAMSRMRTLCTLPGCYKPVTFVTDEDITKAGQAVCKLAQGLIRHNHDRPLLAMLEVCHLNTSNKS